MKLAPLGILLIGAGFFVWRGLGLSRHNKGDISGGGSGDGGGVD